MPDSGRAPNALCGRSPQSANPRRCAFASSGINHGLWRDCGGIVAGVWRGLGFRSRPYHRHASVCPVGCLYASTIGLCGNGTSCSALGGELPTALSLSSSVPTSTIPVRCPKPATAVPQKPAVRIWTVVLTAVSLATFLRLDCLAVSKAVVKRATSPINWTICVSRALILLSV